MRRPTTTTATSWTDRRPRAAAGPTHFTSAEPGFGRAEEEPADREAAVEDVTEQLFAGEHAEPVTPGGGPGC